MKFFSDVTVGRFKCLDEAPNFESRTAYDVLSSQGVPSVHLISSKALDGGTAAMQPEAVRMVAKTLEV